VDFILLYKVNKPCLKEAAYEIPLYLDYWFTRRAVNVLSYIISKPMLYVKYKNIWIDSS